MTENLPATITEEYGTGLEDLDPNEVAVPRLKIDHANALFKDGITGEEFAKLSGVFLGMVKQRIFWNRQVEENAKPRCKSNDAAVGYPNMTGPNQEDMFPWAESGLDPNAMPKDEHGRVTIPCANCPFAQWGGTRQKPKPPPCNELHTYPVMFASQEGGPIDRAGIVQFKGSGIQASKGFLRGFNLAKKPLYSATAEVTLTTNKRGMVVYSTPEFRKTGEVPVDEWREYAMELSGLREFLRQPPRPADEELSQVPGSVGSLPVPTPAPAPQAAPHVPQQRTAPAAPPAPPAQPAAPSSVLDAASGNIEQPAQQDEDELPF